MTKHAIFRVVPAVFFFSTQFVSAQSGDHDVAREARLNALGAGLSVAAEVLSEIAVPGVDLPERAHEDAKNIPDPTFLQQMEVYGGYAVTAYHTAGTLLTDAGLIPWADPAPSFEEISCRALDAVRASGFTPRRAGQPSLLREAGFLRELEQITGTTFTSGNSATFLIDGPASFAVKDRLIREARKSIHLASYSIHDDITGFQTADMLIAKKQEGIEVKVLIDNKVAGTLGVRAIRRMREAGVEILRHQDPRRGGDFWHVKALIVDGKHAVVGGMNYGDHYSHKDPGGFKWRDTDVLYTGPSVMATERLYAHVWNNMVRARNLPLTPITLQEGSPAAAGGSARIAPVFQNPPGTSSPILLSVLKAIYGATRRVNIENSYYVSIPAVTQAILDARARGVEVNILTNSKKGIDAEGKPIADAILKSLLPLVPTGVNIYLKQGETLHSKFMTVDGIFCNIGSYNLHPRGERYDSEMNVNIVDPASVRRLDAAFARDIAEARKVITAGDLNYAPGWMSVMLERYFFGMLSPSNR